MMRKRRYKTVADLLKDPNRWCQGRLACAASGDECDSDSAAAVRWCLVGACDYVYGSTMDDAFLKIKRAIEDLGFAGPPALFNDAEQTTHNMIMEVVRKAGV